MSMKKELIKKFVEVDYKDYVIMITGDNQHVFYTNTAKNPPIVWDWDNEVVYILDTNDEIVDQNKHPMQVTMLSLDEIQYLDAFIDMAAALKFINEKFKDEETKENIKKTLSKVAPSMMGPNTLRGKDLGNF